MAKRTRKKKANQTFTDDYISWSDPRLKNKRELDKTLGSVRGGNAKTGLEFTVAKANERLQSPNINPATRQTLKRSIVTANTLMTPGIVEDKPTTINHISSQFGDLLGSAVNRAIEDNTAIPGTGWYFDQRRAQAAEIEPKANLNARQVTAMGGKLSAGKTPEDEIASLGGISRLVSTQAEKDLGGRKVKDIPSDELGEMASTASSWNTYNERSGRAPRPASDPIKIDDEELSDALIKAGRAHRENVSQSIAIARNEISPQESFKTNTTPKTSAYAEMQAQSEPDSVVEMDARNISAHYRDVVAGKVSKDQGMFVFSQEEPGKRAHALRSDAPTAIDTWMIAAGSGQTRSARPLNAEGQPHGRRYSPAKRLVDKGFPLDPTAYGKRRLGLEGTDASVTPEAAVSAQHNEAIRRLSENTIGPISFDQFGQSVHLPASTIQETVWTEMRRQAGFDPSFNKEQTEKAKQVRATVREEKAAKKAEPEQLKLF